MAVERPVYPDPDVSFGVFRVLPVTTGGFAVYDPRRALGRMTVKHFKTLRLAAEAAEHWHRLGHG